MTVQNIDDTLFSCIKNHLYTVDMGNDRIVFYIQGEERVLRLSEFIKMYLSSPHWQVRMPTEATFENVSAFLVDHQDNPEKRISFSDLSRDGKPVFAYKYARSTPEAIGNSTLFIKHVANTYVWAPYKFGYGLFFFIDPIWLMPYMPYGDILVKIKITEKSFKKMFVKAVSINDEYSCSGYYVDSVYDLKSNQENVLTTIAHSVPKDFLCFLPNSLGHLKKLGASEETLRNFKKHIQSSLCSKRNG